MPRYKNPDFGTKYKGMKRKGCKSKWTNLPNMFLEVIKEAGGTEAVLDWIHKVKDGKRLDEIDRKTFGLFLGLIARMLPNKVEADVKIEPLLIIRPVQSKEVAQVPKKENKDEVKDTPAVSG